MISFPHHPNEKMAKLILREEYINQTFQHFFSLSPGAQVLLNLDRFIILAEENGITTHIWKATHNIMWQISVVKELSILDVLKRKTL